MYSVMKLMSGVDLYLYCIVIALLSGCHMHRIVL